MFWARSVWVWNGISLCSRVTNSDPDCCPSKYSEPVLLWPQFRGTEPCRSGSANVDLPSPPYIVPRSENRAVFCEMGRSCPLQKAQPVGAKLKPNMRISATNGDDMF